MKRVHSLISVTWQLFGASGLLSSAQVQLVQQLTLERSPSFDCQKPRDDFCRVHDVELLR